MKNGWKIVMVSTLPQDIYLARAYLDSEGIETFLQDELTAQVHNFYSTAIGGVKLAVPESMYDRAAALLREGGYLVPADEKQNRELETIRTADRKHCPYCGSENIRKKKDADPLILAFYALLGILIPLFKPVYTCFDCQQEWRIRKP